MNRKLLLQVEAKDDKVTEYHFSLEFYVFQENGAYVAYCPALDLSTCDETYNGAVSSFYEMFQLHIECCVESGTLQEDLLEHGWKLHKNNLRPPTFAALIKKPEMEKLLKGNLSYERIVSPARIPVLV